MLGYQGVYCINLDLLLWCSIHRCGVKLRAMQFSGKSTIKDHHFSRITESLETRIRIEFHYAHRLLGTVASRRESNGPGSHSWVFSRDIFFFEGYQNPPETKKQRKVWGLVIWMIHSWVSLWKVQLDVETLRKLKLFQTRYTYLNLLSISCFHIIFDFCNRIFIARISKRSSELSWTLKILFILYLSIFFIFWNHAQQDQMSNVQSIPETSVVFLFSSKDMSLLKEIVLNSDFYAYIYIYMYVI